MLLARHCPVCRRPARSICGPCLAALPRWASVGEWGSGARAGELGLSRFTALFAYEPPVARLILAAKNGGRHDLLAVLGHALARELSAEATHEGVIVTWVPASRRQARRRGYDQGRELAVALARPLGLRARPLLRRVGGEAQAGRNRADRLVGPSLRVHGRRSPPRVLLVDDVATTGASLARAAGALRAAGTRTVHAVVVAAVP